MHHTRNATYQSDLTDYREKAHIHFGPWIALYMFVEYTRFHFTWLGWLTGRLRVHSVSLIF